jgi:threonine/homoserine/homoserine lactone efflux protein
MPSLSAYAVFIGTALVILLVPGPAVLYVVTRSIEMGRAGGIASVAGITTATAAYVALATAGVSSLVLASTVAFDIVKYAGAAYLIFLGARRLLGHGLDEEGDEPVPHTRRRAYTQGFLVNLANPKMIVFVFAFLPQFVDPHAGRPWLQTLALGLTFTVLAFLSDSLYALAAGTVADRLRGTDLIARIQRWVGGGVLVGLGILAAVWSPGASK